MNSHNANTEQFHKKNIAPKFMVRHNIKAHLSVLNRKPVTTRILPRVAVHRLYDGGIPFLVKRIFLQNTLRVK